LRPQTNVTLGVVREKMQAALDEDNSLPIAPKVAVRYLSLTKKSVR